MVLNERKFASVAALKLLVLQKITIQSTAKYVKIVKNTTLTVSARHRVDLSMTPGFLYWGL